jgi:hypothetical protein
VHSRIVPRACVASGHSYALTSRPSDASTVSTPYALSYHGARGDLTILHNRALQSPARNPRSSGTRVATETHAEALLEFRLYDTATQAANAVATGVLSVQVPEQEARTLADELKSFPFQCTLWEAMPRKQYAESL